MLYMPHFKVKAFRFCLNECSFIKICDTIMAFQSAFCSRLLRSGGLVVSVCSVLVNIAAS